MSFDKPTASNHQADYSASASSDVVPPGTEGQLRAAFNQVLSEVEPRAKALVERDLGLDPKSGQIKHDVEAAYETLAVSALRLAYACRVTGSAAVEAVCGFLAQLREQLENYVAALVSGCLGTPGCCGAGC